jgi:hypothetical protein
VGGDWAKDRAIPRCEDSARNDGLVVAAALEPGRRLRSPRSSGQAFVAEDAPQDDRYRWHSGRHKTQTQDPPSQTEGGAPGGSELPYSKEHRQGCLCHLLAGAEDFGGGALGEGSFDVIVIAAGDDFELDLLGAGGFAFADVGAIGKTLDVHLLNHG